MRTFHWVLVRCSSSCWGACARIGFILVFQFAYSSPTASDTGCALFMNPSGMVLTSVPGLLGGCFMGYPRRAYSCFIFVLLLQQNNVAGVYLGLSAGLEFVLCQIYCNQKKTPQKSEKWLKKRLFRKKIYFIVL